MYRWWWLYLRPDQYLQGSCVLRAHIYAHVGRIWSKGEGSNARVNSVMSNAGLNDPLTPDEASLTSRQASLCNPPSCSIFVSNCSDNHSNEIRLFIMMQRFISYRSSPRFLNLISRLKGGRLKIFFFLFRISKNIEMKMKKWNSYWKNIYIFFFGRISIFLRIN